VLYTFSSHTINLGVLWQGGENLIIFGKYQHTGGWNTVMAPQRGALQIEIDLHHIRQQHEFT
jgi:hypothetical protein